MLEGRRFTIFTDHKPLTYALSRTSDPWSARQARQLSYLAEYTDDIHHIAGEENIVADTLSRPPPSAAAGIKEPSGSPAATWQRGKPESSSASGNESAVVFAVPATGQLIDFAAIAAHQQSCPATLQARGASLLCNTSNGSPRPLIPTVDRKAVFSAFHSLAHAGTRATRRLIAARAVWRGMNSDVASWVLDCQQCCRGKVTGQPAAPVQPIHVPGKGFSHVHVDLVGPLPVAEDGSTYITMMDRSTRWLEAVPLRNMEAKTCVEAFINTRVARYGVLEAVTTDRGRQFTSALWEGLCQNLQINHISTTAYNPQSNGLVERTHRQIKDALRDRLAGNRWPEHLPWVLFGLQAAPKEDSAVSSEELVFGAPLTLPGQLLTSPETPVEDVVEALLSTQPLATRPLTYAEAASSLQVLQRAEFVYVRKGGTVPPLSPLYQGP
jgi:transposase InsO family protein